MKQSFVRFILDAEKSCSHTVAVKMSNKHFAETFKRHTNAHARRGRPTLKDAERQFRDGSFREKANQMKQSHTKPYSKSLKGRNTNSLVRRYMVESYKENPREKFKNEIDAKWESFKTKLVSLLFIVLHVLLCFFILSKIVEIDFWFIQVLLTVSVLIAVQSEN